jgi:hypothetical protein
MIEHFYDHRFVTAQTHGDFQPANILIDNHMFWIIDWEYASRRQLSFDRLVLRCESRRGAGLARRLQGFVDDQPDMTWLESNASFSVRENRQLAATIHLLEELDLRLSENTNICFTQIEDGLTQLTFEIDRWIKSR